MSFAQVYTRSVVGLHAPQVIIEVHLSQGLPALTIVGLPAAAVRESKDRVRSAILNSGFQFPNRRLTINLAPADLPKDGARLDLPIAIGILAASGQLEPEVLSGFEFIGELALNGELRQVSGSLAVARAMKAESLVAKSAIADEQAPRQLQQLRQLIVPIDNGAEASRVEGVEILGAQSLKAVCNHLQSLADPSVINERLEIVTPSPAQQYIGYQVDLADVKGQHHARRALEIAAAGGHSLLFTGPPGSGKTLMASRLPTILPDLSDEDALEVASTYSVADSDYDYGTRPFRQVHHTISAVALVGGGSRPKPGEITLANKGVLFLDELPEFDRTVLEVLRQPLEAKQITISRANSQLTFPANFQLVAAMNPCPSAILAVMSALFMVDPSSFQKMRQSASQRRSAWSTCSIDVASACPSTRTTRLRRSVLILSTCASLSTEMPVVSDAGNGTRNSVSSSTTGMNSSRTLH